MSSSFERKLRKVAVQIKHIVVKNPFVEKPYTVVTTRDNHIFSSSTLTNMVNKAHELEKEHGIPKSTFLKTLHRVSEHINMAVANRGKEKTRKMSVSAKREFGKKIIEKAFEHDPKLKGLKHLKEHIEEYAHPLTLDASHKGEYPSHLKSLARQAEFQEKGKMKKSFEELPESFIQKLFKLAEEDKKEDKFPFGNTKIPKEHLYNPLHNEHFAYLFKNSLTNRKELEEWAKKKKKEEKKK